MINEQVAERIVNALLESGDDKGEEIAIKKADLWRFVLKAQGTINQLYKNMKKDQGTEDLEPCLKCLDRILKIEEVMAITGIKMTTVYEYIKQGKFPEQVKVKGAKSGIGWRLSEIQQWIRESGCGGKQCACKKSKAKTGPQEKELDINDALEGAMKEFEED